MKHSECIKKWLGGKYAESPTLGNQCVSWVKKYSEEVLGVKLGSFGGSAWNGFMNTANTFDTNLWIKGDITKGDIQQEGDILFSPPTKSNPYGHVAIAQDNDEMIEQNGKTGNGSGVGGDAIRMIPNKKDICGYWRLKLYTPENPAVVKIQESTTTVSDHPIDILWNQLNPKRYWTDYADKAMLTAGTLRKMQDIFAHNFLIELKKNKII